MPNWPELMDKHGPLVWSTIRRLVNHPEDAADCFQEVFVAALALSRKEHVLSWTATLRHLANKKAIDSLRRRYRSPTLVSTESAVELMDSSTVSPQQQLASAELAGALRTSLALIEPRQAEVFCMVCLDAMTYSEVATAMGINENHVGVLLNRARSSLKQRLHAYAPTTRDPKNKGKSPNAIHE